MDELTLYQELLELPYPWSVEHVALNKAENAVNVHLAYDEKYQFPCPICEKKAPRYDQKERRWRHLDTCQLQTIIIADIPRVKCKQCGVLQINIPWSERHSRFTVLFESLVIEWLHAASISAVAKQLSLSWNSVDIIMQNAVKRGLLRRRHNPPRHISVDETSFRKGHDYVTVVSDKRGNVVHVEEGKSKQSLMNYYDLLSQGEKQQILSISMDMSAAFVEATREAIPEAEHKIAFDKYHVAAYLNEAVDKVRKKESQSLFTVLKGSRYLWLYNSSNLSTGKQEEINELAAIANKTGRAWMLKEYAMTLWNYRVRGWAERAWRTWCQRANRSRLKPVMIVSRMISENLWGIINAIVLQVDNGMAESVNSRIKILKIKSRGFRNKVRFKTAIMFHYGGLDLLPRTIAHTN